MLGGVKVVWLDLETSGLESGYRGRGKPLAKRHEIVECSIIYEKAGEIVGFNDWYVRPFSLSHPGAAEYLPPTQEALETMGSSIADLNREDRISPTELYQSLKASLEVFIDPYCKSDKAIIAGQNVDFDVKFLRALWEDNDDPYFGSLFDWRALDLIDLSLVWELIKGRRLERRTLSSFGALFDVSFDAHRAKDDIAATRQIFYRMLMSIVGNEKAIQFALHGGASRKEDK